MVRGRQHSLQLAREGGVAAARRFNPCAPVRAGLLQCAFEDLADAAKLVWGQGVQ